MIEEEIASQVDSLREIIGRAVRRWGNYTFQYTNISKEDLIQKMKKAFQEMHLRPPPPPPEEE
jgi:hypothetical protein